MTTREAKAGIRKWLRGDGGPEIGIAWFALSGEVGREALFEMLDAPGASLKIQMNIQQLLLALFYSPDVEQRLLARAASFPDARDRRMKEDTVRLLAKGRYELRALLEQADAAMIQTPNSESSVSQQPTQDSG